MDNYVIFEKTEFEALTSKLEQVTEYIKNKWCIYNDQNKFFDNERTITITDQEYNDIKKTYEDASKETLTDRAYAGSTLIMFYKNSINTLLQIRKEISKFLLNCDGYVKYNIYTEFCNKMLDKHPFARQFSVVVQSKNLDNGQVGEIKTCLENNNIAELTEKITLFLNISDDIIDIVQKSTVVDNDINRKLQDKVQNPFDNTDHWDNRRVYSCVKDSINDLWNVEILYLKFFCAAQNCLCDEKHITNDKLMLIFDMINGYISEDAEALTLASKYTCNDDISRIVNLVESP